jgi:gamma-glutamylcyclotransferase (GGCT)/AIG2-like uncharacterized protein YtfP
VTGARLFVYGTLLDDACVRDVTGRTFPRRRATLAGHRSVRTAAGYPDVVVDVAAAVAGDVLDGLDADALAALDAYEAVGTLYDRATTIVTCDGEEVSCFVYRARRPPG